MSRFAFRRLEQVSDRSGFSLVELILALGIAAFSLLTMVGAVSIGANSNRESEEESRAINLLFMVLADLQDSTPDSPSSLFKLSPHPLTLNAPTFRRYYIDALMEIVSDPAKAQFRLDVVVFPNTPNTQSCTVNLRLSWPGQSSTDQAIGKMEVIQVCLRQ